MHQKNVSKKIKEIDLYVEKRAGGRLPGIRFFESEGAGAIWGVGTRAFTHGRTRVIVSAWAQAPRRRATVQVRGPRAC